MGEAVLVLPRDGDRSQYHTREIGLSERDISFLCGHNSLWAVLQRWEVPEVTVEDLHARNVLTHSGSLRLTYPLLDIELLALGGIDREDRELM